MRFCVSLDHFIPVLLAFVVLGLVSSAKSQEIGWEERVRNDIFWCQVGRKTLTQLTQSTICPRYFTGRKLHVVKTQYCFERKVLLQQITFKLSKHVTMLRGSRGSLDICLRSSSACDSHAFVD